MTNAKNIGENIRRIRERKGMTLTAFADKIGVAKSSIHRYEYGLCENMSLASFIKIADALGVSLDELINHKEPEHTGSYEVPVTFMCVGIVKVEANNKEDLLEKLNNKTFVDEMPLPDKHEYLEGSYLVDFDVLEHFIGIE